MLKEDENGGVDNCKREEILQIHNCHAINFKYSLDINEEYTHNLIILMDIDCSARLQRNVLKNNHCIGLIGLHLKKVSNLVSRCFVHEWNCIQSMQRKERGEEKKQERKMIN